MASMRRKSRLTKEKIASITGNKNSESLEQIKDTTEDKELSSLFAEIKEELMLGIREGFESEARLLSTKELKILEENSDTIRELVAGVEEGISEGLKNFAKENNKSFSNTVEKITESITDYKDSILSERTVVKEKDTTTESVAEIIRGDTPRYSPQKSLSGTTSGFLKEVLLTSIGFGEYARRKREEVKTLESDSTQNSVMSSLSEEDKAEEVKRREDEFDEVKKQTIILEEIRDILKTPEKESGKKPAEEKSTTSIFDLITSALGTALGSALGPLVTAVRALAPAAAAAAAGAGVVNTVKDIAEGKPVETLGDIVPEGLGVLNPFEWSARGGAYVGDKINKGYSAISESLGGSGSLGGDLYDGGQALKRTLGFDKPMIEAGKGAFQKDLSEFKGSEQKQEVTTDPKIIERVKQITSNKEVGLQGDSFQPAIDSNDPIVIKKALDEQVKLRQQASDQVLAAYSPAREAQYVKEKTPPAQIARKQNEAWNRLSTSQAFVNRLTRQLEQATGKKQDSQSVTIKAPEPAKSEFADVKFDATTVGGMELPEPPPPAEKKEVNAIPASELSDPEAAAFESARQEREPKIAPPVVSQPGMAADGQGMLPDVDAEMGFAPAKLIAYESKASTAVTGGPNWEAQKKSYEPGGTPASHLSKFYPGLDEEFIKLAQEHKPGSDSWQSIYLHEKILQREAIKNIKNKQKSGTIPETSYESKASTATRRIAGEDVVPGKPLSDKQVAVIELSKASGNKYSPEIDAAYADKKNGGEGIVSQSTSTPAQKSTPTAVTGGPNWEAQKKSYEPGGTPASHLSKFYPGLDEEFIKLAQEHKPGSDSMQSIYLHEKILQREAIKNIKNKQQSNTTSETPKFEQQGNQVVPVDKPETTYESKALRRIAGEDVVPGKPLSDKQVAVIELSKASGNKYSPEIEAAYADKKNGGEGIVSQSTSTPKFEQQGNQVVPVKTESTQTISGKLTGFIPDKDEVERRVQEKLLDYPEKMRSDVDVIKDAREEVVMEMKDEELRKTQNISNTPKFEQQGNQVVPVKTESTQTSKLEPLPQQVSVTSPSIESNKPTMVDPTSNKPNSQTTQRIVIEGKRNSLKGTLSGVNPDKDEVERRVQEKLLDYPEKMRSDVDVIKDAREEVVMEMKAERLKQTEFQSPISSNQLDRISNESQRTIPQQITQDSSADSAQKTAASMAKNIVLNVPPPTVIQQPAPSVATPFTNNIRNNETTLQKYISTRYAF